MAKGEQLKFFNTASLGEVEMKSRFWWLLSVCMFVIQAYGDPYQTVKEGPIHEAFVVNESGSLLLQPVQSPPPPKITELVPPQEESDAIWIPGYWAWSRQHGVYLWVSGVWRKPPPGLIWIPGQWKNYPQGWIWLSGFWSSLPLDKLVYIDNPPPDPIDQKVPTPPAEAENYFWVPGCWQFDFSLGHYVWYSGRWDLIGSHWFYCPAHYIWREQGFLFVPGFWDWPVINRGVAYSSIYIDPTAHESLAYEPREVVDHLHILEQLFPHWPDYASLFRFHFFFNYDVWTAWGASPPWWNWSTWWSFPATAQWSLWWWWTHPGYPQPAWLDATLAQMISPPPQFVIEMMKKVAPPPFVTANGVIARETLEEALRNWNGNRLPILTTNLSQLQKQVLPQRNVPSILYPKGKGPSTAPEKPFFGPSLQSLKAAPRRVILPARPVVSEKTAPQETIQMIPPPKKAAPPKKPPPPLSSVPYNYQQPMNPNMAPNYPYQQPMNPNMAPNYPYQQPMNPNMGMPPMNPNMPMPSGYPQPNHPMESDNLGNRFYVPYSFPHRPMQTEFHNDIMGHPKFQMNPPGPRPNPVPGDFSTLPGQ